MMDKVRWGVLGTARIGTEKVIPAMQRGESSRITAIASRDLDKARSAAEKLGIERAYGSYEELLADSEIDAIYNPLPNHLHVPWTLKCIEAGKHVLCEKPIAMDAREAESLIAARDHAGVLVGEAFMVRTHPQWLEVSRLIRAGRIGELRSIAGHFSYFNRDASNIRSKPEYGGGALMDIGCYPTTIARWIYGEEPRRVVALVERDPEFDVDRLTSALLDFKAGHAAFTCSTQSAPHQRMGFFGTRGRIEVEIPFNAPVDRPCRVFVDDGSDLSGANREVIEFPVCDQYTIQGDAFSRAIREGGKPPVDLEDAIGNMRVIDALFRSAESGAWESP